MAHIAYDREFAQDLENDLQHLRSINQPGWINTLAKDLDELEAMLTQFPLAGTVQAARGTHQLLRMRARHAPFYIWSGYDTASGADGEVRFLRLFHARQQNAQPRFP